MTITTSGTTLTFNDATTQTTAPVNTNANVNSVSAGTGISVSATTGALTVTNSGVTSAVAGTGITVSGATGAVTISSTATGTVTSVATGNGLQGGTITSSGTLSISAAGANTVGSYCWVGYSISSASLPVFGSNYSAGTGSGQITNYLVLGNGCNFNFIAQNSNLSGTWRWLGGTNSGYTSGGTTFGLAVRVS